MKEANKRRTIAALIDEMLLAIARDLIPERSPRSEPRAKKLLPPYRTPRRDRALTSPKKRRQKTSQTPAKLEPFVADP